MNHRYRCLTFVTAVFAMLVMVTAAAHAGFAVEPPRIDHLAGRSVPLTAQEQNALQLYGEHWLGQMKTGDPESVSTAARRLRDPLAQMGVTAIFRDEYSRAIVPQIDQMLEDSTTSSFVAVNAMQLAPLLGTEQAMRLMVNRSDPQREQRKAVRIWAARGFQMLAESDHIRDRQLTSFLRDLMPAVERETDWHVLLRQFEAISSVPDSMEQQVQLLDRVLTRIEGEDGPSPSMQAVQRAASLMLQQFIRMSVSEQRAFGIAAAGTVVKVFGVAQKHWDAAQADATAKIWYRRAVASSETLLRAIDAAVRSTAPPRTGLDEAWEQADAQAFERDAQQWRTIVQRPPYR